MPFYFDPAHHLAAMRDVTLRANEQLKMVEEDMSALSYLLETLNEAENMRAQSTSEGMTTNEDLETLPVQVDITSLYVSEEARVPTLEDAESVRELLQKLEAADEIASGVEGKVDTLLNSLEELLSSMGLDAGEEDDQTGEEDVSGPAQRPDEGDEDEKGAVVGGK